MPTTIIDELIVELGLDPSKFSKGRKKAADEMRKFREEQARGAKDAVDQADKMDQAFAKVQGRVLRLTALFLGGMGVKEFVGYQTRAGVETERTAGIINKSTESLSRWRGVAERAGGSAEGITGGMVNLAREFQTFSLTGNSAVVPYFRSLGVNIAKANGEMRDMDDIMLDLSAKFSKLTPARAQFFGSAMGFDPATVTLLQRGPEALRKMLDEQKKLGAQTKEDVEASRRMADAFSQASTAAETVGRTLLTKVEPVVTWLALGVRDLAVAIVEADKAMNGWLIPLGAAVVGFSSIKTSLSAIGALLRVVGIGGGAAAAAGGAGATAGWFGSMMGSTAMRYFLGPLGILLGSTVEANKGEKDIYDRSGKLTEHGRAMTGAGASGGAGGAGGDAAPPQAVLDRAKQVALQSGPAGVQAFMAGQGYPMSGAWCGQFAAAVVKSAGGTPPRGAETASNWRNYGVAAEGGPQPGDIAVRRGVPTGSTGSHVTIVDRYDPKTGKFVGIGGNQGAGFSSSFNAGDYDFRRGAAPAAGGQAGAPVMPSGAGIAAGASSVDNSRSSTQSNATTIGQIVVHTQATDAQGIARDLKGAIPQQSNYGPN